MYCERDKSWGQMILVPKDPCLCWNVKLKLLLVSRIFLSECSTYIVHLHARTRISYDELLLRTRTVESPSAAHRCWCSGWWRRRCCWPAAVPVVLLLLPKYCVVVVEIRLDRTQQRIDSSGAGRELRRYHNPHDGRLLYEERSYHKYQF